MRGNPLPPSPLLWSCWQSLSPWFGEASLWPLPSSSCGILHGVCMCSDVPSLKKDTSHKGFKVKVLVAQSCLTLATPWNVARLAPLCMEFSGKNTGAGCHSLIQGIFPTQGLNLGLPHCRQILYLLSHHGMGLGHPNSIISL